MAGFSIDDVRDTIQADLARLLARAERAAGHVVAGCARKEDSPIAELAAIEESGHAIYGSTSLVSADSLASSARLLEELARSAAESLRMSLHYADLARRAAFLCLDGTERMGKLLPLELEHRVDEAAEAARGWQGECKAFLASHPAPVSEDGTAPAAHAARPASEPAGEPVRDAAPEPAREPPARPSQEAASGPSGSSSSDRQFAAELAGVFREELAEARAALQEQFDLLQAEPADLAAVGRIERLLHTIKGASSTVGLLQVSAAAATLREDVEHLLNDGETLTAAQVGTLRSRASALLKSAGVEALSTPPAELTSSEGEMAALRARVLGDAREIHAELTALVPELGRPDGEGAREVIGKLLQRLVGSASTAGESALAEEAARLHELCKRARSPLDLHESLGAALPGLLGKIGEVRPAHREVVRTPVPTGQDPELWDAFVQECAELVEGLDRTILQLEESDDPRRLLADILRATHTLKGVVNTVGLAPTGALLHGVEDFLEELRDARLLPSMRSLGTVLLEVQGTVRRNLQTAPQGYVETEPGRIDESLARLRRGEASAPEAPGPESDSASRGSARPDAVIERNFIRVETERLDSLMNLVGELVVSRSRLFTRVDALRTTQGELERGHRRLTETVDAFRDEHEFSRARAPSQPVLRAANAPSRTTQWTNFSDLELDHYEDVQVLARSLAEISSDFDEVYGQLARGLATLTDNTEQFGSIVGGIQGEVTRARMVPLELLFARLRLPIREAAGREGKEVRVALEGETVSVDKTIADALLQPMIHLVRNAVAHGVEAPDLREQKGKARAGVVSLRARQESGQIVLEVSDDGAGLDLPALYARGIAMGLISAALPADDPSVKELIFAPGLSTRADAGAVSGRGVGGDVVRRSIERLNGTIRVDSEPGRGTTFVLTLPLTLAITKAMLVRQGERTYAVPMYFADRLLEESELELLTSAGQERVKLEGGYASLVSLGRVLEGGAGANVRRSGPVLVLRVGEQRLALRVEAVLGQEEIVVKSLGPVLTGHPLFAGVTQRGSGELVLILDVPRLLEGRASRVAAPQGEPSRPPAIAATAQISRPPAAAPALRPVRLAPAVAARRRVLFADDSISVRKVAEKTLRDLGIEVVTAVDGLDALEKVREGRFDLVFTDLEMPRMHGYELIRELRFLPAFRDLPVVVVTSRSSKKHEQQAMSLGATEYITKPFTVEMIRAVMERWSGKGPRGGTS